MQKASVRLHETETRADEHPQEKLNVAVALYHQCKRKNVVMNCLAAVREINLPDFIGIVDFALTLQPQESVEQLQYFEEMMKFCGKRRCTQRFRDTTPYLKAVFDLAFLAKYQAAIEKKGSQACSAVALSGSFVLFCQRLLLTILAAQRCADVADEIKDVCAWQFGKYFSALASKAWTPSPSRPPLARCSQSGSKTDLKPRLC